MLYPAWSAACQFCPGLRTSRNARNVHVAHALPSRVEESPDVAAGGDRPGIDDVAVADDHEMATGHLRREGPLLRELDNWREPANAGKRRFRAAGSTLWESLVGRTPRFRVPTEHKAVELIVGATRYHRRRRRFKIRSPDQGAIRR